MKIIDPTTSWFKISEVPCFGLADVSRGNNEYIEKLSARVIHMFNHIFNQIWLCRYPCPHKVVFDNGS